mmetsp:Transcript_19976/g.46367  ORF Transcript_19976/g.46367 Transcript_19976/m.46367 type:complete len:207 (+) Transcript_19976:425-1045(+)
MAHNVVWKTDGHSKWGFGAPIARAYGIAAILFGVQEAIQEIGHGGTNIVVDDGCGCVALEDVWFQCLSLFGGLLREADTVSNGGVAPVTGNSIFVDGTSTVIFIGVLDTILERRRNVLDHDPLQGIALEERFVHLGHCGGFLRKAQAESCRGVAPIAMVAIPIGGSAASRFICNMQTVQDGRRDGSPVLFFLCRKRRSIALDERLK